MRIGMIYLAAAFAGSSLLTAGCTTEAWYQSMQSGAEHECKKQPGSAAEECLSRLNKRTYQEYKKERESDK